jgi:anti-sigma factor RsiW
MTDPFSSKRGPHDEAEELLPWYATGQLDADDRAKVEEHLYSCGACRSQLAVERRMALEFQGMSPAVESSWARLKARLDPPLPSPASPPRFFADLSGLLRRPALAALAAAQLMFVVMAGALLVSLARPQYHALGSAPAPASANLIVMFRSAATEQAVRDQLQSAGASIVGGPTSTGAYLLHVDPARRQSALTRLQSASSVELAQPIDGGLQ